MLGEGLLSWAPVGPGWELLQTQMSSYRQSRHPLEVPSLHTNYGDGRVPPHTQWLGGAWC